MDNSVDLDSASDITKLTHALAGSTWNIDENGNIDFINDQGNSSHIGKVDWSSDGRNTRYRGRVFGTYIRCEASTKEAAAAMLVAGYVATLQEKSEGLSC